MRNPVAAAVAAASARRRAAWKGRYRPYTMSGHRPKINGRPVKQNEARMVVNKRKELNNAAPGVRAALAQAAKTGVTLTLVKGYGADEKPITVTWLGRKLAEGNYGSVYRAVARKPNMDALRRAMSRGVMFSVPREGTRIIIKVAEYEVSKKPGAFEKFLDANLREAALQHHLASMPCVKTPFRKAACVAGYVPDVFFAGVINNGGEYQEQLFVTVMAEAPGVPLANVLYSQRTRRDRALSARFYVGVERALASMWYSGVIHNDLHKGNMMFDARTGRFSIIDFGFAAIMPPAMLKQVRASVDSAVRRGVRSLGEVWRDPSVSSVGAGLQAFANRVVYTRKRTAWFNPDGRALMAMWSRMPGTHRAAVPRMRQKAWGYV